MYLTVVAMASLLMMAFNLSPNMNAYASIFSDIQNADDVGQSLECVIVVVGCDGTGSVGSSGDVIIGTGNDDNNTNGGGDTPLPPIDPEVCVACLNNTELITPAQLSALAVELGLEGTASVEEICEALETLTVEAFVLILSEVGLTAVEIVDLLDCLGIEISELEVTEILGL